MLHPLHRTEGIILTRSRLSAKHKDEYFGTVIGTPAAVNGKRYFEVIINVNRGGIIAGWTLHEKDCKNEIGATDFSWGISSFAGNKGTKNKWIAYSQKMKAGDCIGCMVDTKAGKISFSLNGVWGGVAFEGLPKGKRYYPAISLKHKKTSVRVNFGAAPFKFPPEDCTAVTNLPEAVEKEEELAREIELENHSTPNFRWFVPEVLVHAFSFFDAKTLACASMTCRLWSKIAQESTVWQNVYKSMLNLELSREVPKDEYKTRCTNRYTLENCEPHLARVLPCKFTPSCLQYDDNKLICGAGDKLAIFENCFEDDSVLNRRLVSGHLGLITDLQYDDNRIVTIATDECVKIWDVDDFDCLDTIDLASGNGNCVKLFGNKMYCFSGYKTLHIYDLNTTQCLWSKVFPEVQNMQQLDLSDDGQILTVASNKIHIFDTRTNLCISSFGSEPELQALSHGVVDNKYMSFYKDESLSVYDIFTGKEILEYEGTCYGMTCMYSDYGYVACGFEDCDVKVWDVKTGRLVTEIIQASVLEPTCIRFDEGKLLCGSNQTKVNMYTFAHDFEDEMYVMSDVDKAAVKKWNSRMKFYDAVQ